MEHSYSTLLFFVFFLDHRLSLFFLWHSRLGHLSSEHLKGLVYTKVSFSDITDCCGCKLAKIGQLYHLIKSLLFILLPSLLCILICGDLLPLPLKVDL